MRILVEGGGYVIGVLPKHVPESSNTRPGYCNSYFSFAGYNMCENEVLVKQVSYVPFAVRQSSNLGLCFDCSQK